MEIEQNDQVEISEEQKDNGGKGIKPLLILITVLLLINLVINFGLFEPKYETISVDCRNVDSYASEGWRIVTGYSYELGNTYSGYTVYRDCIMERRASLFN